MRANLKQEANRKAPKLNCVVCNRGTCVDEKVPKVIFKINPGYKGRITRSITKILDHISDYILIELYRCMPLLGDEEKVPNWNVHIVHYAVVFTDKAKSRISSKMT